MLRPLKYAALLTCLAFAAAPPVQAEDEDPCADFDIACDGDECLVCWPGKDVDLECEEASLLEVTLTLPDCLGGQETFDISDFTLEPPRPRLPLVAPRPQGPSTPIPVNPTIRVKAPGAK